ncbi:alpha-L-fucosidase [Niabella insulamsoli]|uniref:alpha-L-fucosidase n=1 Tax=Niabella insulamsoli TaxID=3144874 RepID=UPI0031FC704E
MKTYLLLSFILFFAVAPANAQWSVLDNDPRILQPGGMSPAWNVFTPEQWNASNFATPEDMKWFTDVRFGMFISYGLSSYVQEDLSWPIVYNRKAPDPGHGTYPDSAWKVTWPSLWKMEKFDAKKWVAIAKSAGMKYMVIIVKHHDGFHMWDTKFSDFKITNTPFGRDYLKELADACHEANMRLGIYYSQRDWYHPDYAPVDTTKTIRLPRQPFYEAKPGQTAEPGPTHQKYIQYQYNVIKELLTNYGKIDLFWFDAAWSGGMYPPQMWDAENLTRMMRKLQPHIIINNRTGLPGDFDTPEQTIGMYQKRPWESCMTINGRWAYNPKYPNKSVKTLISEILRAASGNGNVLLSWGANFDGAFNQPQKDTLLAIGAWLRQYGKYYYGTKGGPWMPRRDFGAVYKGREVYLYVFNWKEATLKLKALKHNAVEKAEFVNVSESLNWFTEKDSLRFEQPALPDSIVTILKLTMEKPIEENDIMTGSSNLFDNPAYGEKFTIKTVKKSAWDDGAAVVDLGEEKAVTILNISGLEENARVDVSADSQNWDKVGLVRLKRGVLLVTTTIAGAQVPGKQVRYIRLTGKNPQDFRIEVFAQ